MVPEAIAGLAAVYGGSKVTRYARADRDTRASIRQAYRIRRRWRRFAPMAGLFALQAPGRLAALRTPDGFAPVPKTLIPTLKTRPDRFGVTVTANTLPKVGLTAWRSAEESLRDAWGFPRVKISQPKPGLVLVRGFRNEPLDTHTDSVLMTSGGDLCFQPGELTSEDPIFLGFTEDGEPVRLNLRRSAHGLIAGVTRSGKSITTNTLLAAASLMRDVRMVVIDPNLAAAAPWWRTAHTVSSSVQPDEPIEILREIRAEMERRAGTFWAGRTDRIETFSEEMPLILLVIDEVANYTRHPDKKKREAFEAELSAIASQGAKYGVRLWLLAQKPSADVLTTAIRTNLSSRICHRVDTTEDFLHLFPDGRDLDVTAADRSMPPGVSIASLGDMRTPSRMRSVYLSTEDCWRINDAMCAAGLQIRELPESAPSMPFDAAA
ncbi:DNA translocase FtsK [Embleya hyalina]|uniref:DNA translocase FtsK n=2 Tax=Embleya hyalina TaxID=516124 RepID=A0A401YUV1_9ACTN|nr:DNA translocase FtsK [Embleya hyalina]